MGDIGKAMEGHFLLVENTRWRHPALRSYKQATIEWDDHKNEDYMLLTPNEVNKARARAARRSDLIPTGNRLFNSKSRFGHISLIKNEKKKHRFESNYYYFVRMHDYEAEDSWLAFTANDFDIAMLRTIKMKFIIKKKSLIADIID